MKRLILLRHGKAAPPRGGDGDFARPLAERGRLAADAVGRYLNREALVPTKVLVSAAVRTRETHALAAAAGGLPSAHFESELYLAPPSTILRFVRKTAPAVSTLMIIGHNPGLAELVQILADHDESDMAAVMTAARKFPTAALAVFDILTPWSETGPGDGALRRFVTPALLGGIDED